MTGTELKELRLKHGLTQTQVAEALGVSYTKISEWENGRYATISNAYQRLLESFFNNLDKK